MSTRDNTIKQLAVKITVDRGHHPEDVDANDEEQAKAYVSFIERSMRDFRWHSERPA